MAGELHNSTLGSLLDSLRQMMENLPPAPRFDRCAVRDLRVFHSIPRRDPAPSIGGGYLSPALAGIPVVVDPEVEMGVIELRKGDEVIERVLISELRA